MIPEQRITCFRTQKIFGPEIFSDRKFSDPNFFRSQNFFGPEFFFGPKMFCDMKFFRTRNFFRSYSEQGEDRKFASINISMLTQQSLIGFEFVFEITKFYCIALITSIPELPKCYCDIYQKENILNISPIGIQNVGHINYIIMMLRL